MAIIRFHPIARNLNAFDPRKVTRAMEDALADVGKIIKADFEKTTATWNAAGTDGKPIPGGLPKFGTFGPRMVGEAMMLEVSTQHSVYYYLNFGTRSHLIKARRSKVLRFRTQGRGSYRAKTRQAWLGSQGGGPRGPWTMRPRVDHPGNYARGWDITITNKQSSRAELSKAMNRRIRDALGSTGQGVRVGRA